MLRWRRFQGVKSETDCRVPGRAPGRLTIVGSSSSGVAHVGSSIQRPQ